MKFSLRCILSFFFMSVSALALAQPASDVKRTFYIVRHAEKDTGNNPAISTLGKERAADLYRKLKGKKIDLIMVTQYRRTGMTGDSLRIYKKIDSIHYAADATGEMFSKKISTLSARYKNILVIGHSNTVPTIIRQAGVKSFMLNELPDNEYDNLFIVKTKKGQAMLQSKKYGVPSRPANNSVPMQISQ